MSRKRKERRWRLIADFQIQGMLMARVIGYWVVFNLATYGTFAGVSFLSGSSELDPKHALLIAMGVSFLFLPLAIFDLISLSNRFVGPIVNAKRHLDSLSRGETMGALEFRRGDYHKDLEVTLRRLIAQQEIEKELKTVRAETEESCHV